MRSKATAKNALFVLCAFIVLIIIGLLTVNRSQPISEIPPEPETLEVTEPEVEEAEVIESEPVRIRIPDLALDYEIQGTGSNKSGAMEIVPVLSVVSWYRQSAIPGNEGNAILAGHNTWRGERSRLYTLDELAVGDEMDIEYADGSSRKFMLESVFVYRLKTAPADLILDLQGDARVTLITCKPPFNTATGTSDNRIVAIFKQDRVFVIPDPPIEPFPPRE